MKLRHEAPKHARVNYRYNGYTTTEEGWWYNYDLKRWEMRPDFGFAPYSYCNYAPCRSARAFRRKLKKCPKGVEFVLVSRWVGRDVYGKGAGL